MDQLIFDSPLILSPVMLTLLALVFGGVLGYAAVQFKVEGDPIVDQIDSLLPQTQCGQCGHPGCRPYAQSIANGDAINKCPPGGQATVNALADLLGVDAQPLDDSGEGDANIKKVAFIREEDCIGCTKCIQACPIDAIVGAAKQMHTVLKSDCTGCDLCVEPCPVDCIDMLPLTTTIGNWSWELPPPSAQRAVELIATDSGRGVAV